MFDRYFANTNTYPLTGSQVVTVNEKRAPTDDSVRLLKEMEEKATSQVIKAVTVGNTTFECVIKAIEYLKRELS